MPVSRDKVLSITQAAQLIFHTRRPTERQIRQVYDRMKSGALSVHDYGSQPLEWTTTERALADYLAAHMVKKRNQPTQRGSAPAPSPGGGKARNDPRTRDARRLRAMYYGVWRDYFLAVMLRRRMANRSVAFRNAVLAGQIGTLLALIGTAGMAVRFSVSPAAPERVAIERWIDDHTDHHRILRWYPTRPAPNGGVTVEVEYRYSKDSPRFVTSQRTFSVTGDDVVTVVEE